MARVAGAYSTASQAPALHRVLQAMRIMRRFTTAELVMTSDIGESAVMKYCRALAQAGFLRCVLPRVSGRAGSRDVWQLVRDTGPHAPIRRWDGSGVYDRNTGQAWSRQQSLQDGLPSKFGVIESGDTRVSVS